MIHSIRAVLIFAVIAGAGCFGWPGESRAAVAQAERSVATMAGEGAHQEQSIPASAVEIARIGSFPITNSMVVSWIVALGLIVFAQVSMKQVKTIPAGAQNFWEWLVESLYNFLEGIIGHQLVRKTFWFFATIFIFILFSNWLGLIPGV